MCRARVKQLLMIEDVEVLLRLFRIVSMAFEAIALEDFAHQRCRLLRFLANLPLRSIVRE